MLPEYISLNPLLAHYELPAPADWQSIFGRPGPLTVEIGSGVGEFLIRSAKQDPQGNFLGIEFDSERMRKILRKVAQAKLSNVRLIYLDARVVFARFLPPRSVARVVALFPDPWPKRKHEENRLFSTEFLKTVNNRLQARGEFHVVTDFEPYWQWIHEQAAETGFHIDARTIDPQFDTKFERKWRERGQKQFYELRLGKQKHLPGRLEEIPDLKPTKLKDFDPKTFRMGEQLGKISVVFKEYIYDPAKHKALVRVVVNEENHTQNFWVEIIKKDKGWTIFPARGCPFFATAGSKRALELVFEAARVTVGA